MPPHPVLQGESHQSYRADEDEDEDEDERELLENETCEMQNWDLVMMLGARLVIWEDCRRQQAMLTLLDEVRSVCCFVGKPLP